MILPTEDGISIPATDHEELEYPSSTAREIFAHWQALGQIKGGNSYGVPREKWARMTVRQKNTFRMRVCRERRKEDPVRLEVYHARNRLPSQLAKKRQRNQKWREKNRDKTRAYDREYWVRVKANRKLASDPEMIYRQIVGLIHSGIPRYIRDDIASSVTLSILEKKLKLADLPAAVKTATTAYFRIHDTYRNKSLDAPLFGEGTRTLGDNLTAEDLPW